MDNGLIKRDQTGQFLPGSIANPAGRPKSGSTITEKLRTKLMEGDNLDAILDNVIQTLRQSGDIRTLSQVMNRIDGTQKISPSKLRYIFEQITTILDEEIKDNQLFDRIVIQLKTVFSEELIND